MCRLLLVIALCCTSAAAAAAQSLAEVARKEEARRKHLKRPSRVITNKDLKPSDNPAPPPPAAAAPAPAEGTPAGEAPAAPPDEETQRAEDEKAWRQKMADARTALERSQMYHDALQSKINALWAEFTAKDDYAQRALVEVERKRAIAEQERVKEEIARQKQAIADLEEEARRAGVPPGWLR